MTTQKIKTKTICLPAWLQIILMDWNNEMNAWPPHPVLEASPSVRAFPPIPLFYLTGSVDPQGPFIYIYIYMVPLADDYVHGVYISSCPYLRFSLSAFFFFCFDGVEM